MKSTKKKSWATPTVITELGIKETLGQPSTVDNDQGMASGMDQGGGKGGGNNPMS